MNIVVLSHRLPFPPNKGEKIRTYNQLEHLRVKGCDVTLFCTVDNDEELALAKEYEEQSGFKVITVRAGIRKLSMLLGLFSAQAFTVSNFYNRKLQTRINEFFANQQVDALFCTSSAMAEYVFKGNAAISQPSSQRRDLMDFMDLDSDKWRQYRRVSRFPLSLVYHYEEKRLARYESRIQQRFDECIFISSNETELFASQLQKPSPNIKVIGNGVDLTAFRPPEAPRSDNGKTLLFSGVMDYLPNVNAMTWFVDNVWADLTKRHPDARLVIAGMNPVLEIQDMANDNRITVTGYVDDMLACYHQAHVFVAPFQIARGVQNKILQSFACSLPVVTTAVGAEGINCVDGEHYLLAETSQQFVDKISELFENADRYNNIANSALALVHEDFTWKASNERLFGLFENTVNSRAG